MSLQQKDESFWMSQAFKLAEKAFLLDEVPVGAVVVCYDRIIGKGYNQCESLNDATAHAEVLAISAASNTLDNWRLNECEIYVTKEPCAMCAALIANARIRRVYFGASDPKSGGIQQGARIFEHKQTHHAPEIYSGIGEEKAAKLLTNFFANKRKQK